MYRPMKLITSLLFIVFCSGLCHAQTQTPQNWPSPQDNASQAPAASIIAIEPVSIAYIYGEAKVRSGEKNGRKYDLLAPKGASVVILTFPLTDFVGEIEYGSLRFPTYFGDTSKVRAYLIPENLSETILKTKPGSQKTWGMDALKVFLVERAKLMPEYRASQKTFDFNLKSLVDNSRRTGEKTLCLAVKVENNISILKGEGNASAIYGSTSLPDDVRPLTTPKIIVISAKPLP
jgi:hypothetical protein